jgi:hypothetical protein
MKPKLYATIFLFISVILSACGPSMPIPTDTLSISASPLAESASSTPPSTATTVAAMTETTTPAMNPTETTISGTTTLTITPTVQGPAQVVPTLNAYCRKGPNTLYDIVTFLQKGNAYAVVGRNIQDTWWLVNAPGVDPCWVGGTNVGTKGPVQQTLIVQGRPLPEQPTLFVNSYVCDATLGTLGVLFNWALTKDATGYRIYRNGKLLTTVEASLTSYHDDAPTNEDLVYALEAFNDFGVALRVETKVPACR